MAKKRKTLPKDFKETVKENNLSLLKSVFDKCEINAYGGYNKGSALSYANISEDFIKWLVEQGADVNMLDSSGMPPIFYHAKAGDEQNVKLLLELGADIELHGEYNCTPLSNAAGNSLVKAVEILINNGADVNKKSGLEEEMPLEYALSFCSNSSIANIATIADILIANGAEITPKMSDYVNKIGENFEFYRADFNKDYLEETEKSLNHLYKLFNVKAVQKRDYYDGNSLIEVKSDTWTTQFEELWKLLVPGNGSASTVQGEVIRILGKVTREILDNGATNWDKEYKKLTKALIDYFSMGNQIEKTLAKEMEYLAKNISQNSTKEDLYRLTELSVTWVIANPNPIILDKTDYKR